ncbi:uncharacterized protein LOC128546022 isoform X2 [Mercenaria mercenaria]|nr:uncharacterized protein LOC128546022 isoform X2 [Mercenaria mercenaria]XP_053372587.1 uncharacterized protein LOC128546022 isoform X2 [Mercenaria mercenaria]XP_053372589.1 uncharacterized protein LOC128546022 isoform X2 [Mercenaria mercenaria]
MATTDNERHLRYILLLTEGGTDILRELLKRETQKEMQNSGKTLSECLKDNKDNLKQWTKKEQQEKIFPKSGNVDTSEWDLSLLGTVILQLYGNCLTSNERRNIKQLKQLRNDLAHSPTLSMDPMKYDSARKEVASLLIQISNTLDRSVHDRCQTFIKRITTGSVDIQTAIEKVKLDKNLLEKVQHVSDSVEEIAGKVNLLSNNDKIEELKQLLQQQQNHVQSNAYSFPVLGTKMTLKGPDDSKTTLIENMVTAVFEKALKRTRGHTDESKLARAVMSIVEEIKQLDDCEVEIEKQCIRMTVQCKSSDGYLQLLKYFR